MTATIGYVCLALMAAIAAGMFIAACCLVALAFKFGNEPESGEGWRVTIFGDKERGR